MACSIASSTIEVAIVEANRTGDARTVDGRLHVSGAEVVAIIALIDLRGHIGLEPAAKADGGHGRLADNGDFVDEDVFLLIYFSAEDDEGRHLDAARRELRAFAHGSGLLEHVAADLGIEDHRFVELGSGGFAASVDGDGGVAGGVDFDVVLADPDGIAVVKGGAFDA